MNRPKYKLTHFDFWDYVLDLEKYCDELEKALDKACEELHSKDLDEEKSNFIKQYTVWSKDQWKEWCMKDE